MVQLSVCSAEQGQWTCGRVGGDGQVTEESGNRCVVGRGSQVTNSTEGTLCWTFLLDELN